MTGYAPLFDLSADKSEQYLQDEALRVLKRDAKHALKSHDHNERLQGVRSIQLLNY